MTTTTPPPRTPSTPDTLGPPSVGDNALVKLFVAIPFAARLAATPFAWGWGVDRQFPLWTAVSLAAPAVLGGLISWSWWGAATALFWPGWSASESPTTSPGWSTRSVT